MASERTSRQRAVGELKRALILDAARAVFVSEGLEGASLRAIAAKAGYTASSLYFHFDSKEAIYSELLEVSLSALGDWVRTAVTRARTPQRRLLAAGMAFFTYYAEHSSDLDLGFYLFRGGMKPAGLGRARDERLNAALEVALRPIAEAAVALGAAPAAANLLMVDVFAHATGLLLLLHTGRIRMFGASAARLMERHLEARIAELGGGAAC
jgi:AcrR family transcriptional regulator